MAAPAQAGEAGKPALPPGIYIGARNLNWPSLALRRMIPGRHQFYLLVPRDPERFKGKVRHLGGGVRGIVMGAYGGEDDETGEPIMYSANFQLAETDAARDLIRGEDYHGFNPEAKRVNIADERVDQTIDMMLRLQRKFENKRRVKPVPYNALALPAGTYNSNAWVQSLGRYVGLRDRPKEFTGYDPGTEKVIPRQFFGKAAGLLGSAKTVTERPLGMPRRLRPGIYMATRRTEEGSWVSSDERGGLHRGGVPFWHRFWILVPKDPGRFPVRDIGGVKAVVLGGYNRGGRLTAGEDDERDYEAAAEVVSGRTLRDWQTRLVPVIRGSEHGADLDDKIEEMVGMARNFAANPERPLYQLTSVNSNSFATSLGLHAGLAVPRPKPLAEPGSMHSLPKELYAKHETPVGAAGEKDLPEPEPGSPVGAALLLMAKTVAK